jgi:hypothetical protein
LHDVAYGDQFDTAGAGRRIVLDKKRLVIETLPLSVKQDNE